MGIFGRTAVRQQFEVPVFVAARAAARLRTIVIAAHLSAFALVFITDAFFLGNFLAIVFRDSEIYGASFAFWMLFIHKLKFPVMAFLFYVLGRTRISFGVGFLTVALVLLIIIILWEIVTFFVMLFESSKCEEVYCYAEGFESGTPGLPSLAFNIALFSLIPSTIIRIITALIVSFLSTQVRIRNETAIEALPGNRTPLVTTGAQSLTTVSAIASDINEDLEKQNSRYAPDNLVNRRQTNSKNNTYEVTTTEKTIDSILVFE